MLYGIVSETLAQSENKFELILTIIVDQQTIKKSRRGLPPKRK